ncbi:hypothetical protein LLG96_04610, partial [bacterium]|nr:hypothetical protein [bacterium]
PSDSAGITFDQELRALSDMAAITGLSDKKNGIYTTSESWMAGGIHNKSFIETVDFSLSEIPKNHDGFVFRLDYLAWFLHYWGGDIQNNRVPMYSERITRLRQLIQPLELSGVILYNKNMKNSYYLYNRVTNSDKTMHIAMMENGKTTIIPEQTLVQEWQNTNFDEDIPVTNILSKGTYLLIVWVYGDIEKDSIDIYCLPEENLNLQSIIVQSENIESVYKVVPKIFMFDMVKDNCRLMIKHNKYQKNQSLVSKYSLLFLRSLQNSYTQKLPIPPFPQWIPTSQNSNSQLLSVSDSELESIGDSTAWGYQLMSPPIPVPPKSQLTFSASLMTIQGGVGIGILDEKGFWLAPPQKNIMTIDFASGDNNVVTIVVANSQDREPYVASHFKIMEPHLFVQEQHDNN